MVNDTSQWKDVATDNGRFDWKSWKMLVKRAALQLTMMFHDLRLRNWAIYHCVSGRTLEAKRKHLAAERELQWHTL